VFKPTQVWFIAALKQFYKDALSETIKDSHVKHIWRSCGICCFDAVTQVSRLTYLLTE